MGDMKVKGVSVQVRLVADVERTGEGAKVVKHGGGGGEVRSRVEIAADDGFKGTAAGTGRLPASLPGDNKSPVAVGAGKGVLGHLLSAAVTPSVADPGQLSAAELKALLQPFFGRPVVVTTYDKDDASSLKDALKAQSVGDTRGTLVDVGPEGLVLEHEGGKQDTVRGEYWAVARIRLDDGDRRVVAQDPSYPKLFAD